MTFRDVCLLGSVVGAGVLLGVAGWYLLEIRGIYKAVNK